MADSSSIKIRLATIKDAQIIANIHVLSWQKTYQDLIPDAILNNLSVTKRKQQWQHLIKNKLTTALILEKDNLAIGFVSICPSRDKDTNPKICGEISAIYLKPNFWRQKLGEKLCLAALNTLQEMGFTEVIVWVLAANTPARKFYEAMGFKDSGKTETITLSALSLGVTSSVKEAENLKLKITEIRYLKT